MATDAATLKAEGNELYSKNDFAAASRKYTEAIALDDKNAIFFANRAACYARMGRLQGARADAIKATELDPGYAKGWSRLATISTELQQYPTSIIAWQRALAALPIENLTDAQTRQRDQYRSGLAAAISKLEGHTNCGTAPGGSVLLRNAAGKTPGERATRMLNQLGAANDFRSSAWVIAAAHELLQRGVESMKRATRRVGALAELTDAIIMDPRAFCVDSDFPKLALDQVVYESVRCKAWRTNDAQTVIREAPLRLETEGWTRLSHALSATIRSWILRGFVKGSLERNYGSALQDYDVALEVLLWGRWFWKDAPKELRGVVFEQAFILGVKCLRLDAYMRAYQSDRGLGSNLPLNTLLADATDVLDELRTCKPAPGSGAATAPDLALAAHNYAASQAHAVTGFCHHERAHLNVSRFGRGHKLVKTSFRLCAEAYLRAAELCSADDELHVWYLHCHATALGFPGARAKDMLSVYDRIYAAIPGMKKIWEYSAMGTAGGRDAGLQEDLRLREQMLVSLERGTLRPGQLVYT